MSLQLSDDSEDFEDNNDDDEFKGVFKLSVTKKELLIILAPFVLKLVGSYLSNLLDSGFYFNPTVLAAAMGIAAGLCEETIFRGVTVPLGMRYLKSKNRVYIIVYASALIFGLMHIGNIVNGAKRSIALIQGIATIFGGFLFMALYLRTGSIWPSMNIS